MIKSAIAASRLTTNIVSLEQEKPALRRIPVPAASWVLFFGTLAVYWLSRTHLNTFDAVAYANQIGLAAQTGKLRPLFHPHHLLFNLLGFCAWRIAGFLGYGGGPLVVSQSLNAALGAGGICLFYAVLRRLQPAGLAPVIVAAGLAGSFGWWICATDGRVNMPSCVLMLAAFDSVIRLRVRPAVSQAVLAGLLAGLAVLFHESAGLFGIVGAAGVLACPSCRSRWGLLAAYGAAWVLIIGTAYVLVGTAALHLHTLIEFKHWMNAYAERGWWWDFRVLHNLRLDVYGLRHAVFVEPLGRAALAQTPLQPFGAAALGLLWLCYGLALTGLTAAAWAIAASLPRVKQTAEWPVAVICLAWLVLYAAFFTVWCPGAFVFWVPVLVPLGVLLLLTRPDPRLLGTWAGVFLVLNFLAGILPYLKPVAGLSQRVALDIREHTPPRSLVVLSGVGDDAQCEVDIPYFSNRPVLSLHELLAHSSALPAVQAALDKSLAGAFGAHRRVYVLDEIWSRRDSVKGLQKQSPDISSGSLHSLFRQYALVPAWNGPRGEVWRVFPRVVSGRSSGGARRIEGDAERNPSP